MFRINRLASIIFALSLLLITTDFVVAQTSLGGDVKPGRALRLTITGDMKLSFVDRSESFGRAGFGDALGLGGAALPLSSAWGSVGDGFFVDPIVHIGIEAAISEAVNATISLETPFDVSANARDGNIPLNLGEAMVSWEGAFRPDLNLDFGLVDYSVDFSGNGNPFLLDLGNSESAFGNGVGDPGTPQSNSAGAVQSLQAAGVVGHHDLGENTLDVFIFDISPIDSETLFGAIYGLPLDTGDYQGDMGITLMNANNDSGGSLLTVGGGGHLSGDDGMKFYGEIYWQFGDYGRDGTGGTITQDGAYGLVAGIHYDLPEADEDEAPWVDISIWDLSGDDDATDGQNSNFVSYEFNNDTIVLEDAYYGLDIDTNYRAIKVKGGMNLSSDWSVQAMYAYATLNQNGGGAVSNGNSSDKIGDEFDFRAVHRATDYLTFYFNAGTLQNAKALGVGSGIEVISVISEIRF
ncbi:MAG: hypothetical protein VX404_08015 [Planctomycetota bacterium]|nr:hypothetical protein [Planctomycetota bacterium]